MQFLSCDWGSTSFRLALVASETGQILRSVADGPGALAVSDRASDPAARARAYENELESWIDALSVDDPDMPVVLSGMVTSSYGWCEVDYARTPFALDGGSLSHAVRRGEGGRRTVFLGGVRTESDVMRGEESQIVGLVNAPAAGVQSGDFVLILPGTHSKHVFVRGGEMSDFATFMTGEVFDVLSRHSVLRKTTAAGAPFDRRAFESGVATAAEEPLLGALFRARTNGLFERFSSEANASFLSGLLIGSEIAALLREHRSEPLLLCAGTLDGHYATAIRALRAGDRLTTIPADTARGLSHAGHAAFVRTHVDLFVAG